MKIDRREFIKATVASSFAATLPLFATEKKDGGVWCYMLKLGTNMWCDCVSPKSGNLKPKG